MYEGLSDKRAYLQVIGCLMLDSTLIEDFDRPLEKADFDTEKFYSAIYVSIYNLFVNGCQKIDSYAIDSYLSKHPDQYKIFEENNGLQYLMDAESMAQVEQYDYWYHIVRKYSLLRYYESQGLDTRFIYDSTKSGAREIDAENAKFDELTENEIIEQIESKFVIGPNMKYCTNASVSEQQAGKGMLELIQSLQDTPDIGLPFINEALTTITRGARLGCLVMDSGSTGSGKSRRAVANACSFSVPYVWNEKKKKFMHRTICEPTLFITTEMSIDIVQTMVLACVSRVDEDHILWNSYEKGELERVKQAAVYIEESPLYIVHIPDFDFSDIENIIKRYHREFGVNYIFHDYIMPTLKLTAQISSKSKVSGLKEHQILLSFVTELKALAETLNVFIYTSSQLNGEFREATVYDQNLLSGAKSLAFKLDVGMITMPIEEKHRKKIENIEHHLVNKPEVTHFTSVYKVRRGKLTRLMVWSHINLGNMVETPVFVTDYNYNLIDVDFTKVEVMEDVINEHSVLETQVKNEPVNLVTEEENDQIETANDQINKQDNTQDSKQDEQVSGFAWGQW